MHLNHLHCILYIRWALRGCNHTCLTHFFCPCFSGDRRLYTVATCCQGGVKALPLQWLSAVHGAGLAGPGQAEGQSLERLSADHQITPHHGVTPGSGLHWDCTLPHGLWGTWRVTVHLPAPPKTQPDCEPSKALHHLVTPTHTGWYYYHVKVRFTFKYYNTVAQIYVNNCCAHAHTVYKHTLICPKKDADRRNTLQSAHPPPARGESSAANHKPWLAIAIANPPQFIFVSFFVANCVTMVVNNSSAQHNERWNTSVWESWRSDIPRCLINRG